MTYKDNKNEEDFRREVVIKSGNLIAITITLVLLIRNSLAPYHFFGNILLFCVIFVFASFPYILNRKLGLRVCSIILLISLSLIAVLSGYYGYGIRAPAVSILIVVPLLGLLTGGRTGAWTGLSITFVSYGILIGLEYFQAYVKVPLLVIERIPYYLPVVYTGVMGITLIIGILYERYREASDKEILDLTQKAYQSAKMASLGEMAAGIAHEINNPLTIILLSSKKIERLMSQSDISKEKIIQSVQTINETTLRASKIINDLLVFSRGSDDTKYEMFDLADVIHSTLDLCHAKLSDIGIQIDTSEIKNVRLVGNKSQISQVLLNLISNSHDAVEELETKWIRFTSEISNNEVLISVIDSGHGIPDENSHKIMQPFFTTKEVGKGTGLGLSISTGIIEAHKGKLWVDKNHPNTKITFSLPLIPA